MQEQFQKGQRIGRYEILNPCLGSGGSGIVLLVVDSTGKYFALKMLSAGDRLAAFEKFKAEHKNLVLLPSHPNIAIYCDFGLHNDTAYIVTEYIDGENLFDTTYNLSPADSIRLFLDALEGLDFIHRNGLLHLDIKPENMLVQKSDRKVKIIDLGIASIIGDCKNMGQGTFPFIAPEIVRGRGDMAGVRSDLFSFAAAMYYCLTRGELPFPFRNRATKNGEVDFKALGDIIENEIAPPPVSDFRSQVSPHVAEIISILLAKDPRDRCFGSVRAVINAIKTKTPDAFLESAGVAAAYLIPEGNRLVGREILQKKLTGWMRDLTDKPLCQPPIVFIGGEAGMGKSYILQKTAEGAAGRIESLHISRISFPADDVWLMDFAATLEKCLTDNANPVIVFMDDVHEFILLLNRDSSDPAANAAKKAITSLVSICLARSESPQIFGGVKPVFVCLAFDDNRLPSGKIAEFFGIPENKIEKMILKPFTPVELNSYLKATPAFKHIGLPREWVDNFYKDTCGVPAVVKERLETIDSRGLLFDLEGNIVLNPAFGPPAPPPVAAKDRFRRELAECGPCEREMLEIMAVWDFKHVAQPITHADLRHIMSGTRIEQTIDRLIQRGLIESLESGLKFVSCNYLPAFIYDEMQKKDREFWHMKIGQYLAENDGDKNIILLHAAHATDGQTAARAAMKLGKFIFIQKGDTNLARAIFERGLEISARKPKLFAAFAIIVMDVYQQMGCFANAISIYERAQNVLTGHAGTRAWLILLFMRRISLALQEVKLDEAEVLLEKAGQLLPANGETPLSLAIFNYRAKERYERAMIDNSRRKEFLKEAEKLYQKNMELEKKLPPVSRERVLNNNLGLVLLFKGDYAGAIDKLSAKLALHKKVKDFPGILFSTLALADARRLAGDFDISAKLAREALDLAKQTREGAWIWRAHHTLANVLHDSDRFEEAIVENNACLACSAFLEDKDERLEASIAIWVQKGHCYKELRQFDNAVLHFQAVIDAKPAPFFLMSAYEGLGEVNYYEGKMEESLSHLDAAQKLLDEIPTDTALTYRASIRKFMAMIASASAQTPSGK